MEQAFDQKFPFPLRTTAAKGRNPLQPLKPDGTLTCWVSLLHLAGVKQRKMKTYGWRWRLQSPGQTSQHPSSTLHRMPGHLLQSLTQRRACPAAYDLFFISIKICRKQQIHHTFYITLLSPMDIHCWLVTSCARPVKALKQTLSTAEQQQRCEGTPAHVGWGQQKKRPYFTAHAVYWVVSRSHGYFRVPVKFSPQAKGSFPRQLFISQQAANCSRRRRWHFVKSSGQPKGSGEPSASSPLQTGCRRVRKMAWRSVPNSSRGEQAEGSASPHTHTLAHARLLLLACLYLAREMPRYGSAGWGVGVWWRYTPLPL